MYEDLKKPGILKYLPIPLIRPLPCLYYFIKFSHSQKNEKATNFFNSNIDYLDEALVFISNRLEIHQFKQISRTIYRLKNDALEQKSVHLSMAIEKMACVCECNIEKIKKFIRSEKTKLNEIYKKNVLNLIIVLVNTNANDNTQTRISSILQNNCNYNLLTTAQNDNDFSDNLIKSDLVVFNSTFSPNIHQLMDSLNSFEKPGMALVPLSGQPEVDRISLRHGNQIKKKGYHVIYKSFSPIRMFTSIDREYLKYNLTKH